MKRNFLQYETKASKRCTTALVFEAITATGAYKSLVVICNKTDEWGNGDIPNDLIHLIEVAFEAFNRSFEVSLCGWARYEKSSGDNFVKEWECPKMPYMLLPDGQPDTIGRMTTAVVFDAIDNVGRFQNLIVLLNENDEWSLPTIIGPEGHLIKIHTALRGGLLTECIFEHIQQLEKLNQCKFTTYRKRESCVYRKEVESDYRYTASAECECSGGGLTERIAEQRVDA